MATNKIKETEQIPDTDPMEIMESIFIPKESGEDLTFYVGLNGKSYLIPRGKTCKVPKPVADIVRRSRAAQEASDEYAEAKQAEMNVVFGAPV